ncbi:hypothetical protein V242_02761, partial [Staphylococcus aureus H32126]
HIRSSQGGFGEVSDMLEIFLIGFGVYLFYRIAIIFLKSKKTIHTNIYEMLMLATIFMISTFAYKHQKTHILIAFLVMFFMSKLKQVQGSYEE